ncbi:MAG TPA: AcrB/AcrD/AcrF family protein [Sphingomicrobium sp.]|nr:AcrB/AcrD/AcrF family protein [Sphingomicrobium sp.]
MEERKDEGLEARVLDWIARNWKWIVFAVWLAFCASFVLQKWNDIRFFNLSDTDDNMRMMQVRGLLHGQAWFDLRDYRMNPPFGANIHWSRLVDLPIAGLILALRPFLGGADAEKWAVAIAPMLPYLLLLFSLALTTRRLIDPRAYPLVFIALMLAGSTNGMFLPERIDHHGWQLALLALSIASLADPKQVRGGLLLGISSALSLAIGLEMIIYLALMGVAVVLFWVADVEQRERLRAYALSMTAGTALCFLIFASYDNRAPVCDALSPVWLSDALIGGALMFALAWLSPKDWRQRLALAVVAGAVIGGFHALMWPRCLGSPENVSPEVQRLWMRYVREARPVYKHGWRIAVEMATLPVVGAIGFGVLAWRRRADRDLLRRVIACAAPGIAAGLLLLWQTRTGPAAEMMGVPGSAALICFLVPLVWNVRWPEVRIGDRVLSPRPFATALAVLVGCGAIVPLVVESIPEPPATPQGKSVDKANALCASLWGMHPIAMLPKGMVFTFIDLGPRLITVTHHDTVAGPYHRNGQQIADVMNAWRGSADQAYRIMVQKYHSNYVLSCPDSSTTTIFMSEVPKGFYGQLEAGQVPKWLKPVPLPKDSPFKMWRVVG